MLKGNLVLAMQASDAMTFFAGILSAKERMEERDATPMPHLRCGGSSASLISESSVFDDNPLIRISSEKNGPYVFIG